MRLDRRAPTALSVAAVSKTFRLPRQRFTTFKQRVLHPIAAREVDELRALREISFEVPAGEFFGIVGRNGSGKSTLLKCLAGIYDIDDGRIEVTGRLSPFIELGVGFNPELTARENVYINAIMLGLSRRQARERFDDVIAFAELEDFVDLKLKNYSSGMHVRLAFAVAIQVDADILLIDEVLAVGDAAFQQKCYEQFHRLQDEGKTIIFVTHDMGAVERYCHRAMLLEKGRMLEIGEPKAIARRYNEVNFGHTVAQSLRGAEDDGRGAALGREDVEVLAAWFEDGAGERIVAAGQGERCVACFEVAFRQATVDPVFTIALRNEARTTVFAASSEWTNPQTGAFGADGTMVARFAFDNLLAPSRYVLTVAVARAGGMELLAAREDMVSLVSHATHVSGGVVDLPCSVEVTRG